MTVRIIRALWLLVGVVLPFTASQALADGAINETIAGGAAGKPAEPTAVTVYTAKKIITMESCIPDARAVAVDGKRVLAVGTLDEVRAALGERQYTVDETFDSKIVMPGLIDQHLHPILGPLTRSLLPKIGFCQAWSTKRLTAGTNIWTGCARRRPN